MTYIRYTATTKPSSPVSAFSLAYLRSLVRITNIRVVNISGGELEGQWAVAQGLLATPMTDPFIANVVCTEPENWAWRLSLALPKTDKSPAERAEKLCELYTADVRNVLIATTIPKSRAHCEAAQKYEAVVCPTRELADKLAGAIGREPIVIPCPVVDHMALRAQILT